MAENEQRNLHSLDNAAVPTVQLRSWTIPNAVVRKIAKTVCISGLIAVAGYCSQNFLTLRGVVDLNISRVNLGIACSAIAAALWITVARTSWRWFWRIVTFMIMLLTYFVIDWWAPKPEVIVSPRKVKFPAEPLQNFPFAVKNKTDDYVYAIQVAIKFQKDSPLTAYSFDVPFSTRKPPIEGSKFADIVGVQCIDVGGRPMAVFWIYRMAPGETRELSVTHRIASMVNADAVVATFSKIAISRMDDVAQFTQNFRVTEPMMCNGAYSYGLDPNTPPRKFTITVHRAK
jgi:hypothetical protein